MAGVILQSASLSGVNVTNVRPRAFTYTSTFEAIARDEAYCYETLTGQKVPGAASIAATPHIHDGTNGALVRIPLYQEHIGATLPRQTPGAGMTPAWARLRFVPFFVPAGVTSVDVVFFCHAPAHAQTFRASILDTSLALYSALQYAEETTRIGTVMAGFDNYGVSVYRIDALAVAAGAVNVLKFEVYNGETFDGLDIPIAPDRSCTDIFVVPSGGTPTNPTPLPTRSDQFSDDGVLVPTKAQGFEGINADMIANDRAVSSYLLVNMQKNDAAIFEIASGIPAGLNPALAQAAHVHQDDAANLAGAPTEVPDGPGADFDQPLGAWGYGTQIALDSISNYLNGDVANDNRTWSGRLSMATLQSGVSTTEIFRHNFRIPAMTAANSGVTGSSPKLRVAVLFYSSTANDTVGAQIYDTAHANGGGSISFACGGGGDELQSEAIKGHTTLSAGGGVGQLSLTMQQDAAKTNLNLGIYGACVYYEA